MKKVKIALLGFGNVGRGVWKILQANGEEISKRSGYKVEVGKILVRNKNRDRGVKVPDEISFPAVEYALKLKGYVITLSDPMSRNLRVEWRGKE